MNGQLFPNHFAWIRKNTEDSGSGETLQPLSAANPAALCHHKGTSLHVTPLRKGRLISLQTSLLISSLLTLVSLHHSIHPQWVGLRCKKRMQVRELRMHFKRLEMHPMTGNFWLIKGNIREHIPTGCSTLLFLAIGYNTTSWLAVNTVMCLML